jgi:hypothetical protein
VRKTLCGLAAGIFFATTAHAALPDNSHRKESSEPQAYCVNAKAEFYKYGGGSCEPGFQVASGNCGNAIEMWMIKVACGIYYSRLASEKGVRLHDDHQIDEQRAFNALLKGYLESPAGMYFAGDKGNVLTAQDAVNVGPIISTKEKRVLDDNCYTRAKPRPVTAWRCYARCESAFIRKDCRRYHRCGDT